jgi:small conductance mechanosensitive channel
VAVAAGPTLAVLALAWLLLPERIDRLYRWLDRQIPADLEPFQAPTRRLVMWMLSGALLAAAGLSIADTLGLDTSPAVASLQRVLAGAGRWLLPRALRSGAIILGAFLIIRVARRFIPPLLRQALAQRRPEPAEALARRSQTLERVAMQGIAAFVVTVAALTVISELGINISALLAGAGLAGVAIGFGAQSLVRDILAGVVIMLEDQYDVGDVVQIAGVNGVVEDFNLRRTVLRDLDLVAHTIPNGEIRTTSNFTKERSRVNLNIEVAYKEDLDHCIAVLNRVGQEMKEDPSWGPFMKEPLQVLRVESFGESGIAIKVLGETLPMKQWDVAGEYRRRVKQAFDKEGIEIPFPHRTIYWGQGRDAGTPHSRT